MTFTRIVLLAALTIVGGALAGLLMFDHYGLGGDESTVHQLCGDGPDSGCEQVSRSTYSSIGGISLGGVGLFYYASLFLLLCLALAAQESAREGLAGVMFCALGAAVVLDAVLLGIQAFAIGAFCRLCIATYVVNLAGLAVLWPAFKKLSGLGEAVKTPMTRSALTAWAAGSLVLLVSLVATERMFAAEQGRREANLLGTVSAGTPDDGDGDGLPPPTSTSPPMSVPADGDEDIAAGADPDPADGNDADAKTGDDEGVASRILALENQVQSARAEAVRLQQILDDPQKYQDYQAERATREFEAQDEKQLALDGTPFKGPASAPIRVVEFSDFLCPFCRSLAGAFSNYLPQSAGRIAIYYKNYPLDQDCNPSLSRTIHPGACELALGAVCAHEQDKFWNMHDRIFQNPPTNPNVEMVVQMGGEVGLDRDALRACMGSDRAKQKLAADIEEAKGLEVASTPTVYINGRHLAQLNGFLNAINSEAERLGLPPTQE